MPSLATYLEQAERSLKVRLKRIDSTNGDGKRSGSAVELEAAENMFERAATRLEAARARHAELTSEASELAGVVEKLGGTPALPEGFTVYTNPDVEVDDEDDSAEAEAQDPDVSPELLEQPRSGGRFVARGSQV